MKRKGTIITALATAFMSLFAVGCKGKNGNDIITDASKITDLAGIGVYALSTYSNDAINELMSMYESDNLDPFVQHTIEAKPILLDARENNSVGITYVASCSGVEGMKYLNARFAVPSKYANNYENTQKLLPQLLNKTPGEELQGEELQRVTEEVVATLKNIVDSSKIQFSSEKKNVNYTNFAHEVLQKYNGGTFTATELENAEILNTTLTLGDNWNVRLQTPKDENGKDIIETNDRGNALLNRIYNNVNFSVEGRIIKNDKTYYLHGEFNDFSVTCTKSEYNPKVVIKKDDALKEITDKVLGDSNYDLSKVAGSSYKVEQNEIGTHKVDNQNKSFSFEKPAIVVNGVKNSRPQPKQAEPSMEDYAAMADNAVKNDLKFGEVTVSGITIGHYNENGDFIFSEEGEQILQAMMEDNKELNQNETKTSKNPAHEKVETSHEDTSSTSTPRRK